MYFPYSSPPPDGKLNESRSYTSTSETVFLVPNTVADNITNLTVLVKIVNGNLFLDE